MSQSQSEAWVQGVKVAGAEGSGADILGALSTTADSVSKYKLELQLPSLRILPLLEVRFGR